MNIRKFVGATSRDALRLVREALGPDAVVLSNRTMDDGSVEIVALADSDLAAITPKAREVAQAGARAVSPANPYASAMPDVFSSVFGASPEAGAEAMPVNAPMNAAKDLMTGAPLRTPANLTVDQAIDASANETPLAASKASVPTTALPGNPPAGPAMPGATAASAAVAPGAAPAASAASSKATAPRTMAESNPWLIDHARRIAAEQQQQSGVYSARPAAMTPAVATAKGLGSAVDARPAVVPPVIDTPAWAREAAEVAARRTAQKIAPAPSAADESRTSAAVAEAIKGRMEQVVKDTVMHELSSMRDMMEEHFAGLLWGDRQRRNPARAALTKHLFAAGFSAQLVQMMADNLPADIDTMDGGMDWVRSVLESNLPVMEDEDALMERGGVFALMGPTGVGKTTTTAKLAARCVMRFGASKVALLTTDSYRIGGHEQLRIFGKILGVSVHAVKDSADLQLALSELRNKHIVLIDTIGMSQRDRLVSDQIAMLCRAGQPVQRLLLLNATSHGDTLNEVVQAYQRAPDQQPLAGCILTKLDEATNLGGVLDAVIRYKLPVHYVSTGQKVPENLYVATKKFLIKSTFCIPRDNSPFVPHDDDIPALLSSLSARSTAELHEVRFG
ncbi:flagellar biosynthesis protein FlhF [Paraburkholderia sp. MMS20-SJTN17]|uniref:Flagellar biosynthesis protein FlhF n=1 Tax=Paraburkholderia translucens TaxID=2886945 RepID=A0ABS8KBP5_9BURK|nr:flagellar biosynthesis protein FlhF [Paraburkholderia sp. MMS20-SJTN17]MCC8402200.1 flagellar biosynthesis protein FlhF [Paraburkholderia sp. MMS20-SJTN17]